MELGKWIEQERKRKELGQHLLADKSGLTSGTISRLENGVTSPTVESSIRVFTALGGTLTKLGQIITNNSEFTIPAPPKDELEKIGYPVASDVEAFDRFCYNSQAGKDFIRDWLNRIKAVTEPDSKELKAEDIARLVENTEVYTYELHYPASIDPEIIQAIYLQGGVLLREDAFAFIANELIKQKVPLSRNETRFPASIVTYLRYSESARKIKLPELVKVDGLCKAGGKILGLALNGLAFDIEIIPDTRRYDEYINRPSNWRLIDPQKKYGVILVLLSRWIYHLKIVKYGEADWLNELRSIMAEELSK